MKAFVPLAALAVVFAACSGGAHIGKSQSEKTLASGWFDPEDRLPRAPGAADRGGARLEDATVNDAATTLAIVGATILTAAGKTYENGTILVRKGRIEHVGAAIDLPDDAVVLDGKGRYLTPGIIDTHSHIGVYASPDASAHADGNEMTGPLTPQARAEYGYWPQDPNITRARAGGVTTALILPGSANLIGGQGFTAVMKPGTDTRALRFPGAPATIKMACGENPKAVYGQKGGPQTRMALYAAFRAAFQQAAEYDLARQSYAHKRTAWLDKARAGKKEDKPEPAPDPLPRDLGLETLAAVLRGEILVQIHCYRASEMRELVAISREFGFDIRSFHHALEAYKIRDLLVDRGIAISTWADWWGFKLEAFDGIPQNAALMTAAGGRAVIHSDSAHGIQRLNQEAAKAMYAGREVGVEISEDQALRWITANPAWVLGIDSVTGTLEQGKRADLVLWSGHPFSVYSKADVVIQGGEIGYRRELGLDPTDFELDNSALEPKDDSK